MKLKGKEQSINNELFKTYFTDYQSPSIMYKKLREPENTEINKTGADLSKKVLNKLKRIIGNTPKDDAAKTDENEKIIDVVERILELNNKIQSGQELKILTTSQMLSRLPIFLSQLKAGINSGKLKNEIRQLLYSLYRSQELSKTIYNNLIKTS